MVVANEQTEGRGRLEREWATPPGSGLAATFVTPVAELLSLRAGVATAEAVGSGVRLKWPNDLILPEGKLGGVLVEVKGERALVGIGVNLAWAPPGAASVDVDREDLVERLQATFRVWLEAPSAAVLRRWRELSVTLGRRVRVVLPQGTIEGRAEDVDSDGALIVDGQRVTVGDVILLREASNGYPEGG